MIKVFLQLCYKLGNENSGHPYRTVSPTWRCPAMLRCHAVASGCRLQLLLAMKDWGPESPSGGCIWTPVLWALSLLCSFLCLFSIHWTYSTTNNGQPETSRLNHKEFMFHLTRKSGTTSLRVLMAQRWSSLPHPQWISFYSQMCPSWS